MNRKIDKNVCNFFLNFKFHKQKFKMSSVRVRNSIVLVRWLKNIM